MRDSGTETALPPTLTAVIERVIRGTRLWPSEKRDVRAELESHFLEGLFELAEEGLPLEASVHVLCESFGNPELAAKLIRRGKKRGRPMIWKLAIGITTAIFGVAAAGGSYAAYLKYAKPNPTVDYVAELNEPTEQIAASDRAWPVMREALLAFEPIPKSLEGVNLETIEPGQEHWTEIQAWIEKNRPLMAVLREAVEKPHYGFIYGGEDTTEFLKALAARNRAEEWANSTDGSEVDPLAPKMIGILLPHLAEVRGVSRFLVVNARELAAAGRLDESWGSLDLCARLGAKLFEGKTLIEQLVGVAVLRLADNEVLKTITQRQGLLSPHEIEWFSRSRFMSAEASDFSPNYEGERLMFADVVQYVFTDDGKGNGRLIPSQYAKVKWMGEPAPTGDGALDGVGETAELYTIAAQHADRIQTMERYDRLWKETARYRSLPLYDENRAMVDTLLREIGEGENARRFALLGLMAPNMNYADQSIRESAMSHAAIRTVIAMARYRSELGVWPATLDQLVPEYVKVLPVDIYSGAELRYVVDDSGAPTLYSVGRNLEDDGGSTAEVTSGKSPNAVGRKTTADLVYYPMSKD